MPKNFDIYQSENLKDSFKVDCNFQLKRECSGYRLIGDKITPLSSEQEIEELEKALGNKENNAVIHLDQAKEHFSNHQSPDYRNSVKESISYLGSIFKQITKESTFGKALNQKAKLAKIPTKILESITNLYTYTNNSQEGIRHEYSDTIIDVGFDEAKLFLVVCSAFGNYATAKLLTD